MQKALEAVQSTQQFLHIVEIVQRTREDHRVKNGASPRASQALFKTGRASEDRKRSYVTPDDIKGIVFK